MSDQDKREKVINELEASVERFAIPQSMTIVEQWVVRDALALLKAQEIGDAEMIEAIRKAPIIQRPVIEAAPVVHGQWKVYHSGPQTYPFWDSYCSVCGYKTAMVLTDWHYCPACGAKMDGEKEDGENGKVDRRGRAGKRMLRKKM